jgi:hypothetical protein
MSQNKHRPAGQNAGGQPVLDRIETIGKHRGAIDLAVAIGIDQKRRRSD